MLKTLAQGGKRWVKKEPVKSAGLPNGHRLGTGKKGRLIFYHHCLCCVERMEGNNKWQRLYRRRFYLKTSVSVIAPQKPVLHVLCMHVCLKYLFCPCFAICSLFPPVLPSTSAGIIFFFLSLFFQHVSIWNFDGGGESFSSRSHPRSLHKPAEVQDEV